MWMLVVCEWVHGWDPAYVSCVHLCSFLQCLLHRDECLWNMLWTTVQRNISRQLSSCYTHLYMLLRHVYTKLCLKDSDTGRFVWYRHHHCINITTCAIGFHTWRIRGVFMSANPVMLNVLNLTNYVLQRLNQICVKCICLHAICNQAFLDIQTGEVSTAEIEWT